MIAFYLPPLLGKRGAATAQKSDVSSSQYPAPSHSSAHAEKSNSDPFTILAWVITLLLVLAGTFVLVARAPRLDKSPDSLKPKNSQAYAALEEVKAEMNRRQEPLWAVVQGRNEAEVQQRL